MTPIEALRYLDDIAHGRKMEYDAHELKNIVESELKKQFEILRILKESIDKEIYESTGKRQILMFLAKGEQGYETIKQWLEEKK